MEQKKCLGVYLSYNNAVGVLLAGAGTSEVPSKCFNISTDPDLDSISRLNSLIGLTAKKISDLDIKFDELMVSVDCAMYAQHDIQSEFSDAKQIQATIAFDAEEAVATDANDLAVAFNITGKNALGSNVTVFTAKRELMANVLDQFKAAGLDPIYIEPDIVCLWRYLQNNISETTDSSTLTVVIAKNICYLVSPSNPGFAPSIRSFLVYPNQDIIPILQRQIPITIASFAPKAESEITTVALVGEVDGLLTEPLSKVTGLNVITVNPAQHSNVDEDTSAIDYAIACGTALSDLVKTDVSDFRQSFAPFQGKKRMMQKSFRVLMTYLTIFLIAAGVYLQAKVIKMNSAIADLEKKSAEAYSAVMYGKPPRPQPSVATQLTQIASTIKKQGGGLSVGDETSVPAQLTYLLQAINTLPGEVELQVSDITISARSITIIGNTKNRRQTLALADAIKKHPKLKKGKEVFKNKAGTGDTFTISAELL